MSASRDDRVTPREWNAGAYHTLSAPQFAWGSALVDELALRGDERVLDAGCGTGRLTAELVTRVPNGRVTGFDASTRMLEVAARHLGDRATFVHGDLAKLQFDRAFDVVFSTATLHWVHDSAALWAGVFRALVPGGRLLAQMGGAGNVALLRMRLDALMKSSVHAARFAGWREPWVFRSEQDARDQIAAAGFVDVTTRVTPRPTPFADRAAYRAFLREVVVTPYLEVLGDDAERDVFLDQLCMRAAGDTPPYTLDYVRLTVSARRPS